MPCTASCRCRLRNLGCDSAISTKTSSALRHDSSSPEVSACAIACSISGTSSWKRLRVSADWRASKKEASPLRPAMRTAMGWSGCSEPRKTSSSVSWYGTIFSHMKSASALKMVSDASCMLALPLRVPCSMKGSSSGHPFCWSALSRLMPSWPTASHTFLRMCCFGSLWMHASRCDLSAWPTAGESTLINEPCAWVALAMTDLRSSTAQSARTSSAWLVHSMCTSPLKSASLLALACSNAASACLRMELSWDLKDAEARGERARV